VVVYDFEEGFVVVDYYDEVRAVVRTSIVVVGWGVLLLQ